ncbi:bile acid-transporting ATPase [Aureobasidium subglaciale]|nr:bile acid-transporting ATPase [Aureobasidium subglaciale]
MSMLIAFALVIISLSIRRKPSLFTENGIAVDAENSSSIISRCSMHWSRDAIRNPGALPALDRNTRSKSQPPVNETVRSLFAQILTQRVRVFAKQWILTVLRTLLTFGSPYCVLRLVARLESGNTEDAWIWLFSMAFVSTCETVIHYHQNWMQWSELGIPIRAQLILAIYRKVLRGSTGEHQSGKDQSPSANTLLNSDTAIVSKFSAIHYILPLSGAQFIMALVFLGRLLGWRALLITLFFTVLTMPINNFIVKKRRATRKELRRSRDQKDRVVGEMIKALHYIKLQASEDSWKERINNYRDDELRAKERDYSAQTAGFVWKIASPLLVSGVSIFTNAFFEGQTTASVVFTILELLPQLQGSLGLAPLVIQDFLSARSASRRIESFLRTSDQEQYLQRSHSGAIDFKDASVKWPFSRNKSTYPALDLYSDFELRDVNVRFPVGELSIIYGDTGCGKSLLLAAILGEAELLDGVIEAPRATHDQPVAFVTQTPWLQSTTIKNNIVFGERLDMSRYNSVLEACALIPDLKALSRGDETLIGPQGIKVSGGQRARISLARALYSKASTILLDDILSALDTHVSAHVLGALNGPLGAGRTRILATHQLALCMPKASYAVCIADGTAQAKVLGTFGSGQDTVAELGNGGWELAVTYDADSSEPPIESDLHKHQPTPHTDPDKVPTTADATRATSWTYIEALGGQKFVLTYCSALVLRQILITLPIWTLKNIKAQGHSSKTAINDVLYYTILYAVGTAFAVLSELVFNAHEAFGTLRASDTLFKMMLDTVLRMPLAWLDSVSTGDLIQRFSTDSQAIDDTLMAVVSEFSQCFIEIATIVIVGLNTSIYTGLMVVGGLYASFTVGNFYNKARKTIQRADRRPTSQMLDLVTTTTTGVSTIRAFGAQGMLTEQMHSHVDHLSGARRHFWMANRWLGLQMSLIGIVFSFMTGIVLLRSGSAVIDPPLFGFALTFSMRFSGVVFKAVNGLGAFEKSAISASAIATFQHLETEDQDGLDTPSDWPRTGSIEVRGLKVRYSAALPRVLNDISFSVAPGQRVGIVGRTGAGKSTLSLAMLRMMEAEEGTISIDGIDVSTVRLADLRRRIGYIPQSPLLFSGTVRTNLDPSDVYSDTKLEEALQRVMLFSSSGKAQSGGSRLLTLDTPVAAGGENISHGQRQLLCVARIFLQNHKLIILDEATSAVDDTTDEAVQTIIRNDLEQTLIVVAHRLKTVATFDKIIVVDEGRIVEQGSPKELLELRGAFCNLVTNSRDSGSIFATIANRSTIEN